MALVPSTNIGKLTFYEAHLQPWSDNAAEIGLGSGDSAALSALVTAARAAYNAQQAQLEASKAATEAAQNAIRAMHSLGATQIARIRAYAESTNTPNVFVLAQIPSPADPSTVPPPGKPYQFTVTLSESGALTLRWKSNNPPGASGTGYEILRKIGGGPFVFQGSAGGDRTHVDSTLPAGSTGVVYQVTGVRAGVRGPEVLVYVNFGVSGGGGMTVTGVTETVSAKMAA